MVRIVEPSLRVERIDGRPGERRLVVEYDLVVDDDEPIVGWSLRDRAVVVARDEHDAPVPPSATEIVVEGGSTVAVPGATSRRLESEVHRVALDVEQDWWDTDDAGGTTPIAEFEDHLVAHVVLMLDDEEIATAWTPVVSGSWGALGAD